MRIAVVTPHYRTPQAYLQQCVDSVSAQTMPCTQIIVCDGDDLPALTMPAGLQVIRLPQPHGIGNTARAIGSASAVAQDFDAIALLDSDNWFDPNHIERLVDLHTRSGAAFCSSARRLVTVQGEILGICPEVDGKGFVDTNCMFYTRRSFPLIACWFLLPSELNRKGGGDRWVWHKTSTSQISRAHHDEATVNYRTNYAYHYRAFGRPIPANAKETLRYAVQKDGSLVSVRKDRPSA